MKHIKHFNESFDSILQHGISEIDYDEMVDYRFDRIEISQSIVDKLNSALEKTSIFYSANFFECDVDSKIRFELEDTKTELYPILLDVSNKPINLSIYQLEDEWFLVSDNRDNDHYYKCDQLDCLVELLKILFDN